MVVIEPPSEGGWPDVSVIKPEQVAELASVAALEEAEFEAIVAKWVGTDEFAGWSDSDVSELLRELSDLAEAASLQGKCLMLWRSV